jgi:hypothetical protein
MLLSAEDFLGARNHNAELRSSLQTENDDLKSQLDAERRKNSRLSSSHEKSLLRIEQVSLN